MSGLADYQSWYRSIASLSIVALIEMAYPFIVFQPVIAQVSRNCQAAQSQAAQRLAQGRDLRILEVKLSDSKHPDYPSDRPKEYTIHMRGNALESIFNSPQMLKSIATDILNACPQIGRVRYARAGSGEAYSIGFLNDGRIDFFTCAEELGIYPRLSTQPLRWGVEFCSM